MKQHKIWTISFCTALTAFTAYVMLDTFVIPRTYDVIDNPITQEQSSGITDNTSVSVTTYRQNDTTIYVADIYVTSPLSILTAFANNSYGKNVKAVTSEIASDNDAAIAINGDFYGARNEGYVIRNGVLYRDTVSSSNQEDLVMYTDGSMEIITEGSISADELLENGAWQVWSFGPGLIDDGTILVDSSDEVDQHMSTNPRTSIGIIDENHYLFIVADGRTDESYGLSLYEMAEFMKSLGATTAYNLDGGGSSTIYYDGKVINNPTTDGNDIKERRVSDIVYIN